MSHPAGASPSQGGAGRPAVARRLSPAALLVLLIRGYQRFLSPLLGPRCRFVPSCSEYAAEALQRHGAVRGLRLTCWRLLRCQPFCRGGYDPVPPQRDRAARQAPAQGETSRTVTGPLGAVPSEPGRTGATQTRAGPEPGSGVPGPAPPPASPTRVREWQTGSLARPARKGRGVRHNGAHGGRADVATSERDGGPDGAPGPPGRGDSTC